MQIGRYCCENSQAVRILPHNSGTVTDGEKVQLRRTESRPLAFQRAINQDGVSPLTSLKWGSDTQICRYSRKFRPKAIRSLIQSFII